MVAFGDDNNPVWNDDTKMESLYNSLFRIVRPDANSGTVRVEFDQDCNGLGVGNDAWVTLQHVLGDVGLWNLKTDAAGALLFADIDDDANNPMVSSGFLETIFRHGTSADYIV